jgi:MMPL family
VHVGELSSPWQSTNCATPAIRAPGNPELLNSRRGSGTALVVIKWADNHFEPSIFQNTYDSLKTLRSPALEVEFTGNAFAQVGQSAGSGSSVLIGFAAALIILALVFRTVAATVLPLASAAVSLITGLGFIFMLSHVISVSNIARTARRAGAGHLFDHDDRGERVAAFAAVGLGNVDGVERRPGQGVQRLREPLLLIDRGRERRDLRLGHRANRLAQLLVLLGQGVAGVIGHHLSR